MPNNDETEKYYTQEAPKVPLASTEVEVKGYGSLSVVKPEESLIQMRQEEDQAVEEQQEIQGSKVRVKRLNQ